MCRTFWRSSVPGACARKQYLFSSFVRAQALHGLFLCYNPPRPHRGGRRAKIMHRGTDRRGTRSNRTLFSSPLHWLSGACALGIAALCNADFGVPITATAPLNVNAATDDGDDEAPALMSDGQGTWLCVWHS